jgi:hypothetical protein
LVHSDDVNLLGENINTANKNRYVLSGASREIVGLEVNAEKTSRPVCSGLRKCGPKCWRTVTNKKKGRLELLTAVLPKM